MEYECYKNFTEPIFLYINTNKYVYRYRFDQWDHSRARETKDLQLDIYLLCLIYTAIYTPAKVLRN